MGKFNASSPEQARSWTQGILTAASGNGSETLWAPFNPGGINLAVWGIFAGTVAVEKSYDGGVTVLPVETDLIGTDLTITAPRHFQIEEVESMVLYRARCIAWTSGSINVRLSQG